MKKREITYLSLLERDGRPCRGGKLGATYSFVNSLVPMKRSFFREFGSAHAASAEDNEP